VRLRIEVAGTPAPKGSARAFMVRGPNPRAVVAPGGSATGRKKTKAWEQAVREAANAVVVGQAAPTFVDVSLFVSMVFRMARPAGHWAKRGGLKPGALPYPRTKPDLDKLVRSTADALKGSIYDDDSRIVAKMAVKIYAAPGTEGATITVEIATTERILAAMHAGDAPIT
jgi:Holliday junction resolvase RusA-like endonuclease